MLNKMVRAGLRLLVLAFFVVSFLVYVFNPFALIPGAVNSILGDSSSAAPPARQQVLDEAKASQGGQELIKQGYEAKHVISDPRMIDFLRQAEDAHQTPATSFTVFARPNQGVATNENMKDDKGNQVQPDVIVSSNEYPAAFTQTFADGRGLTCYYPKDVAKLQPAWVQMVATSWHKSLDIPVMFQIADIPALPSPQVSCYTLGSDGS